MKANTTSSARNAKSFFAQSHVLRNTNVFHSYMSAGEKMMMSDVTIAINELNISMDALERYVETDNAKAVEYWCRRVDAACKELERIGRCANSHELE